MVGIYCVLNRINSKRYIGQSTRNVESRLKSHREGRHSNKHLQDSIHKYGIENFDFIVIEECKAEDCDMRERYWIEYYGTMDPVKGYNKTSGGESRTGYKHNEETKKKIGDSQRGVPKSEESRRKLSQTKSNRQLTEREIAHLESMRIRSIGAGNYWYKRRLPESTIEASRRACQSPEHREKMSELAKRRTGEKNHMYGKRGELSPIYGRVSITKECEVRLIPEENLQEFLDAGWLLGIPDSKKDSIRKSKSDIYIYEEREFYGSYEIRDYLRNNGYPKLSQNSVYKLSSGISVQGYESLLGKITFRKRGSTL